MLVVMTGLPATGKSTIAAVVADALDAPVYSVDPLEGVLIAGGVDRDLRSGYLAYDLAAYLAEDQLQRRQSAVVDAVNALDKLRDWFLGLAKAHHQPACLIETICSNTVRHREIIETRDRRIPGFTYEVTWEDVLERRREYQAPRHERLVLDLVDPLEQNTRAAIDYVNGLATLSSSP